MTVLTKTDIPLVDLKAQYRTIRDEVRAAIDDVLESMQLTIGPNVKAFDQEYAACRALDPQALKYRPEPLELMFLQDKRRLCHLATRREVCNLGVGSDGNRSMRMDRPVGQVRKFKSNTAGEVQTSFIIRCFELCQSAIIAPIGGNALICR